jgi:hypothetical protein
VHGAWPSPKRPLVSIGKRSFFWQFGLCKVALKSQKVRETTFVSAKLSVTVLRLFSSMSGNVLSHVQKCRTIGKPVNKAA